MNKLLLILASIFLSSCQHASKTSLSKEILGNWKIESVNELKSSKARIEFKTDGKMGGNNGCNNFFGQYKIENNQIIIGPMGSTKMLCQSNDNEVEQYFNIILSNIKNVQIINNSLIIESKDNKLIKGFRE